MFRQKMFDRFPVWEIVTMRGTIFYAIEPEPDSEGYYRCVRGGEIFMVKIIAIEYMQAHVVDSVDVGTIGAGICECRETAEGAYFYAPKNTVEMPDEDERYMIANKLGLGLELTTPPGEPPVWRSKAE